MSGFGMFAEKDSKDLFLEAFSELRTSVDKGLDPSDIEALYFGNFTNDFFVHQSHWGAILTDALGLVPTPATRTEGACASSGLAFREACFAIASGFYDVVLVGGVEDMSKRSTAEVAEGLALAAIPYELDAGFNFPGVFGAIASAYFQKHGATREHLMNVTIKSHLNAALNRRAQLGKSVREMMEQGSGRGLQAAEDLTSFEATRAAAHEAYQMAGLKPADIQFAEVHDCFSIAELLHIEDLGFFEHGTGHLAVADEMTRLNGSMPINTSGGLKCKGHPVGATGAGQLVEVWTQLRQQAGDRQVPGDDLRIGLAHNLGGTGGTSSVTILRRGD